MSREGRTRSAAVLSGLLGAESAFV